MADSSDPTDSAEVAPDELIYRRLSVHLKHYDPETGAISPEAFHPNSADDQGISVDRAESDRHPTFRTPEEAAKGPQPGLYYVSVHRAGEIQAARLTIKPDPVPPGAPGGPNPGHALISEIMNDKRVRQSPAVKQWKLALATLNDQPYGLCLRVEGPFGPFNDPE